MANFFIEVAKFILAWALLEAAYGGNSEEILGYCDDGTPSGC